LIALFVFCQQNSKVSIFLFACLTIVNAP
jgi:hypothetical protein